MIEKTTHTPAAMTKDTTDAATTDAKTSRNDAPGDEPLAAQIIMIAAIFQRALGIDPDFRAAIKEAALLQAAGQITPPPGRPRRAGPGLIARRATNPLARLYIAVWQAETAYLPLPLCRADSKADRDRINAEIGHVLALDRARDAGLITGWTVCWAAGRFPKWPKTVRLLTPWGRKTRERCLGDLARHLSQDRNRRAQRGKDVWG